MTTKKKSTDSINVSTKKKETPIKKRVKYGGRQKGTPNKATVIGRETIKHLLSSYAQSGLINEDFTALDPRDRISIAEKLMTYIIPRYQSISVDLNASLSAEKSIINRLHDLSE